MAGENNQTERQRLLNSLEALSPGTYSEAITQKVESKLEKGATYAEVLILELHSIIDQRTLWSKVLLGLVSLIIVCDMFIIFFTGFGALKFEGNATLPLFIGSNLAQIFVLSVIVVKFLFKADIIKEKAQESRR